MTRIMNRGAGLRSIDTHSLATALLAVAVIAGACAESTKAANLKPESARKVAPNFTLKDSYGATVHLSDYRGKVVLLDFWATWCAPCQIEIPWFMDFEQKFKGQGLAVVGVSMDEDGWDVVKPYIEKRRMNYPILLGDDHTAQLYGGVDALPTTFLLDREGRIAAVHKGLSDDKNGFLHEITELLGARRVPGTDLAGRGTAAVARAK
jgi:cytochrome c biogenesis protein CcmG/thiol:disulfide interchange protein DsbE